MRKSGKVAVYQGFVPWALPGVLNDVVPHPVEKADRADVPGRERADAVDWPRAGVPSVWADYTPRPGGRSRGDGGGRVGTLKRPPDPSSSICESSP